MRAIARHVLSAEARPVLVIALTFKLGLHVASSLLKPMAVDFGWSKHTIGIAVVTTGTAAGFVGAAAGGIAHRVLRERRALAVAMFVQALTILPLMEALRRAAPPGLTTAAIAIEHFGSGFGTTILFAALMTATRPSDAGLHYTILTSANAVAVGLGGLLGGFLADHGGRLIALDGLLLVSSGRMVAFAVAAMLCFVPAFFLSRWDAAANASRASA